ncbi:hypothetical protein CH63R_13770 [Colletotrichum higginsianum IMI 349063]|uniref:Uncharacterized protein n=2 Tax=Colletotrichum higginsianum (strain IMI 349063) TaxID=759273 RepID=A0A1B7XS47_COLHI|nr:hypothetical protein CH63R_13770 [Colletotrichum higginsianum IMI 349063]OBR02544.1 hypothetical protein CH63R_13770 [Colletotrichum higginsianum IMI 349063]
MCTQEYTVYRCGCVEIGEFYQCDEKYDAQSSLKCSLQTRSNKESRNYCSKHLVSEDKVKDEFRGRGPRQP